MRSVSPRPTPPLPTTDSYVLSAAVESMLVWTSLGFASRPWRAERASASIRFWRSAACSRLHFSRRAASAAWRVLMAPPTLRCRLPVLSLPPSRATLPFTANPAPSRIWASHLRTTSGASPKAEGVSRKLAGAALKLPHTPLSIVPISAASGLTMPNMALPPQRPKLAASPASRRAPGAPAAAPDARRMIRGRASSRFFKSAILARMASSRSVGPIGLPPLAASSTRRWAAPR